MDADFAAGPRGRGPLRGDSRILDVDVLEVTPKGRERLALVMLPWWRSAGRWTVAHMRVMVGAIVLAVLVALAA